MTQEQINAIAEAIKYELTINQGSVHGTVAVNRVATHIAHNLRMLDQAFPVDSFYVACDIGE